MKTATLVIETVAVLCPHCEGVVTCPSGTEFWTADELNAAETGRCVECAREVKLPKAKSVRMR